MPFFLNNKNPFIDQRSYFSIESDLHVNRSLYFTRQINKKINTCACSSDESQQTSVFTQNQMHPKGKKETRISCFPQPCLGFSSSLIQSSHQTSIVSSIQLFDQCWRSVWSWQSAFRLQHVFTAPAAKKLLEDIWILASRHLVLTFCI